MCILYTIWSAVACINVETFIIDVAVPKGTRISQNNVKRVGTMFHNVKIFMLWNLILLFLTLFHEDVRTVWDSGWQDVLLQQPLTRDAAGGRQADKIGQGREKKAASIGKHLQL
jgi:hypothetical protein